MRFKTLRQARRTVGASAALILGAGSFIAISASTAGAAGGPSPFPSGTSSVTYEVDGFSPTAAGATGSGDIPIVVGLTGLTVDGASGPLYPQGKSFDLSGVISYTESGAALAGLAANHFTNPSFQIGGFELKGDPNNSASGTWVIPDLTGSHFTTGTSTVTGATWSGNTITAAAHAFDNAVGDGVAPLATFGQGTAIIAVSTDGSTATLSAPVAAGSGSVTLYASSTVTQSFDTATTLNTPSGSPTSATPLPFSTTAGPAWELNPSTTSDVLLAENTSEGIGWSTGPISMGGGPQGNGDGTSGAVITGWTTGSFGPPATFVPGPGLNPATGAVGFGAGFTPAMPPTSTTPLQSSNGTSTYVVADAISIPLNDPAPIANSQNVNLGVGGVKSVSLSGSATSPGHITSFQLLPTQCPQGPSITGNTLQCSLSGNSLSLDDTGQTGVAMFTIQFTVTDSLNQTSTAGSVIVSIGTPPVDQPLSQLVNPGQLQLSCVVPGAGGYPSNACTNIDLPQVTLNGLAHSVSSPANTIYVSDNRGDPNFGWSLTTYMVATQTNTGEGGACSTYVGFCASLDAGGNPTTSIYNTVNGKIAATDLSISGVVVSAHAGNNNTAPTGSGGTYGGLAIGLANAAPGFSGGTFDVNGTFNLTIPSSVYAGTYLGTVEYLVQ